MKFCVGKDSCSSQTTKEGSKSILTCIVATLNCSYVVGKVNIPFSACSCSSRECDHVNDTSPSNRREGWSQEGCPTGPGGDY